MKVKVHFTLHGVIGSWYEVIKTDDLSSSNLRQELDQMLDGVMICGAPARVDSIFFVEADKLPVA